MATTTSNLGLVKPTDAEYALITELNANSDKIDAEVGKERSNFALVQNGDTATQAISKDQLVVWKGVLKKASANIASGATLSGSNLSDDTIAAELAALNSNLFNRFKEISSGSVKDITDSGVYYLTTGVSDLPSAGQAYLCVMSVQNLNRIAGIFVGVTNRATYSLNAINRSYQYSELALNDKLTKIQTDTINIRSGVAFSWSLDASSKYLISVVATSEPLAMFIPFIEDGSWKLRCYNNTTMQQISTYDGMSVKYAYVDI